MKSEGRKYEKALVFTVLIAVLAFVSIGCASVAAIYVPDNYTKIQWAVDNASAGDTIIVRDGTYVENVDVNKRLMIRSENGSATTFVNSFLLGTDYVNISGFTVDTIHLGGYEWTGIVIKPIGVNYCNISNNVLRMSMYDIGLYVIKSSHNIIMENNISNKESAGIYMDESSNNNIIMENNVSQNGDYGIYLLSSDNNILMGNNVSNNKGDGIYLGYSANNTLINNTMSGNRYNFYVQVGTDHHDCIQNIDTSNMVNGKPVYYLVNQQDQQIPDDAGYVGVVDSTNITVRDLTLTNNSDGVFFAYTDKSRIENITSSNNSCGIHLLASSNNIITKNNLSNNFRGIKLETSSWYGGNCNNNTVTKNNILNNKYGIYLSLFLSNNKIYLNNFINNSDNVSSDASYTIWNSTSKITYTYTGSTYTNYLGNYWDDYEGTDADADGIGDTPYSIDSDKDNHPLVEPFEHYFEEAKPTVSISTDKYEYTGGDTMLINLTLTNPTEEPQPVYFAWRLDLPDYDLQYGIMTKALYLPPDYEQTFTIPFTLGDYGIPFNASWFVAFYNTTTLEVLSEDTADWRYVPAKERARDGNELMPEVEEIAREISKTVEKIKFPT